GYDICAGLEFRRVRIRSFSDENSLITTYTPTADEIENGSVTLTLTTVDPDGDGPCSFDSDSIVIYFNPAVVVNAGDDQTLCSDEIGRASCRGSMDESMAV